MYCFPCYLMNSALKGWTTIGNWNYTNLTRVVKSHDKNVKHIDAVNAIKRYKSGKSSITDSFIDPETVKRRESEK